MKKYKYLYEDLFIPRAGSYRERFGTGSSAILYHFFILIRVLVVSLSVVCLLNSPLWAIFIINFSTLFIMIASEILRGLKTKQLNTIETFNEFLILQLNYHLLCFTNFVTDPPTRTWIGYSFMFYTSFFIFFNIMNMLVIKFRQNKHKYKILQLL